MRVNCYKKRINILLRRDQVHGNKIYIKLSYPKTKFLKGHFEHVKKIKPPWNPFPNFSRLNRNTLCYWYST